MSLRNKKAIVYCALSILSVIILFDYYSPAISNESPSKEWRISNPEEQGMRSEILADMMEYIIDNNIDIDSILIVRNGKIIIDSYFYPFSKGQKHPIRSCTKSIMSALIGIAINKGFIESVNQPITDFFPDHTFANMDDQKKSITLEDFLMMSSGLNCRDSYLYNWVGLNEMRNSPDWVQYVLNLPMAENPGDKFEYCNGVSHVLSAIIQKSTQMKTSDFASKFLFGPLGIVDFEWAANKKGVDIGYGQMWLKPHDMAKFGWLYLNKGKWKDTQLIPSKWIEESTRGHIHASLFNQYGYQWWVDSEGFYLALGYGGQYIIVVPEQHIVAVFTSDLTGPDFRIPRRLLSNYIIRAAKSSEPLPLNTTEQARLDSLVKKSAKVTKYTWKLETDGVSESGAFIRKALPSFKFHYPPGSKKTVLSAPNQIMRMKTLEGFVFSASVGDIPEGIEIGEFGPQFYVPWLEGVGSKIKVISNKEIILKCGTKAYLTDIQWLWKNSLQIKTLLVSVYKDSKYIYVSAHPWISQKTAEPIVMSLTLK